MHEYVKNFSIPVTMQTLKACTGTHMLGQVMDKKLVKLVIVGSNLD
jgi:hypothetical protein